MNCKTMKHCLAGTLLGASLLCGKVSATPVFVPDFSFENYTDPTTGNGLADGTASTGPDVGPSWSAAANNGVDLVNPTNAQFAGTTGAPGTLPPTGNGSNYLSIGAASPSYNGFCWQTITNFQANTVYTLTVAIGNTLFNDGGSGSINLLSGRFPGGTTFASAPVYAGSLSAGTFADSTLVFTTGQHGGSPLTIVLEALGGTGTQVIFDNVRLDATAAAPAAQALPVSAFPGTNVYVGTAVTLNEDPSGTGPFTYQWQTDNGTGGASFSNVSGATATNLVINTSGFGSTPIEYQVIVSNSLGGSTSAPVIITASQSGPVIAADTLPSSGSDVIGSSVTFAAVFNGTQPITYQWQFQDTNGDPVTIISGATNSTYTLTGLQIAESGFYFVTASNALGTMNSTEALFLVDSPPPATNGVDIFYANQTGLGGNTTFSPSWTITTNNDLLAGLLPSTVGPGDFNDPQEHIGGTPAVLTDGQFGTLYPGGITSPDVVTGGTVASGAGQYLIYTLPAAANGWDVTNVVSYGGWADAGRDEQRYIVYYSTVAAPTNFTQFASVLYLPSNPTSIQCATRATISPSGATTLAKNVAALKFDFSTLDQGAENGFVGYSEIQVYGTPSLPSPILASDTEPGSASDVVGATVVFSSTITGASYYQWLFVSGGVTNQIPGATNQVLTLTNIQSGSAGTYMLYATNSSGSAMSSGSTLTVNPVNNGFLSGNGNVVANGANQTGRGATYTPNWVIATNADLILGLSPSANGSGVFNMEDSGGIVILTDGLFGSVGNGINTSLATVGQSAGTSLTYTLSGPASGYDITNITDYGGWSDGGRDQQAFTISYSTVQAPTVFNTIATVSFNPTLPGSVPDAVRLMLTSSSGPLATNVSKLKWDFTNPGIENGYGGLAELTVYGVASSPIPLAPYVTSDIIPVTGSDVVGSQVTFTAAFNGTTPISYQWQEIVGGVTNNIPGATSSSLTLTNLQLANSGFYQLQASNSVGLAYSSSNAFTVNPVPAANGNGIISSPANQTANGGFYPTWTVAPGSLIAGALPSSSGGGGSFTADSGEGGLPVLTDGLLDEFGASVAGLATCGSGAGGHFIIYSLSNSPTGYNLSSIISYGGWADGGRDQQAYTVSYSTVANPSTFTTIGVANFNPVLPGSVPSADRVTFTSSTSSPIATNVALVEFNFTSPAGENGYSGYAEFQIFGTAVGGTHPKVNTVHDVAGNLIMTGSGGTAGHGYTILTTTNVGAPLTAWTTNTTGTFDSSGDFSNSIPINVLEHARFFLLRTP